MKAIATEANTSAKAKAGKPSSPSRYTKVLDRRNSPVRGLWQRNGRFYANLTIEDDTGKKKAAWVDLAAATVPEAIAALRAKLTERDRNEMELVRQTPKLADYAPKYLEHLATEGKRPATVLKVKGALAKWCEALGHLRLSEIRPRHLNDFLAALQKQGMSGRTCNLYLIMLRKLLKNAKVDGYLRTLPSDGILWRKSDTKSRSLVSVDALDRLCEVGRTASKNGPQFVDYIRFLAFSGARRNEALGIRWADVDFERGLLTIGADGDTKNREARRVNLNAPLEAHLREMHQRRALDSEWLFPSPQRGDKDKHAQTFHETLKAARAAAGLPRFGFHDCRHHFISFCVMSGIDFMTIARWVGHKDGGILIGKVYGHLSNEHAQLQASRLSFRPAMADASKADLRSIA